MLACCKKKAASAIIVGKCRPKCENMKRQTTLIAASFAVLVSCNFIALIALLCYQAWLAAAIGAIAILALAAGYRFYSTLAIDLSSLSERAKGVSLEWKSPLLYFPEAIEHALSRLEEMQREEQELRNETARFSQERQLTQLEKQAWRAEEEKLRNQIRDISAHVEIGMSSLDKDGIFHPPVSDSFHRIMGGLGLKPQSIHEVLRLCSDAKKSRRLQQWLAEVFVPGKWRPFPDEINPLPFAHGREVGYLKFDFAPLGEESEKIFASIRDVTEEQQRQKSLESATSKLRNIVECAGEMSRAGSPLAKGFVEEAKNRVALLEDKLEELHKGNPGKVLIHELLEHVQHLNSNGKVLQLKTMLAESQKIETLLHIALDAPGQISHGQVCEIREQISRFVELIQGYASLGDRMFLAQNEERQVSPVDDSQSSRVKKQLRYLMYAGLSGTSSLPELIRYIRQLQETFESLEQREQPRPFFPQLLFEFTDLLDRVLEYLSRKFREREVKLEICHAAPRILVYGDYFKIAELTTMVIHASLMRGEITSGLKVSTALVPLENRPDMLEMETEVTIRNTSRKTLQILENWKEMGKKYSVECGGEMVSHKRGFRFHLPVAVNKYFPASLKIALMGGCLHELEQALGEVARWFPFFLEIVVSPSDYTDIAIVMAESKALETLGRHIQDKRDQAGHFIPLIALVSTDDEEIQHQMFRHGANECLQTPPALSDLRWCLLLCLDIIARIKIDAAEAPK